MNTINKDKQEKLSPLDVLNMLKDGNQRFINNLKANRNLLSQVNQTSDGQFPVAAILSCIDSRTSAELIFDQGLGDVFSIRIAGNILNEDILGSMEFACLVAGAKLIVVMGHTRCGAINGACDDVKLGHLTHLLSKLKPAVDKAKEKHQIHNSSNEEFVNEVSHIHIDLTINNIKMKSQILGDLIASKKVGIVGAYYNVTNGLVEFFDEEV
ncbi:MAG TPA: carbonic anhydrase family protein [Bacteroidia bacterium]|nr:carbonic anhydrase family protein [Bacteroidia bacterium]HNT79161.1 carbonic anhydrase family protein [Bacteroidia bacterium]